MIKGTVLAIVTVLALFIAGFFAFHYRMNNLEAMPMDDAARAQAGGGSFVKLSQGTVHYELTGPEGGRTVVLVHGYSVPYYIWDTEVPVLTGAGYRVLRYDLYGRGYSDRPEAKYDDDFYDRQLTELLDALHIAGPVDIMGLSMGGPIIATFACRHPERVRTVSFFDPAFSHGEKLPWQITTPILGEYIMDVSVAPGLPKGQMDDFVHPERFPDWQSRYVPQMRFQGFRNALLNTMRNYLATDRTKDFACVGGGKEPVFLTWGKQDRSVPFDTSREMLSVIPRAQFVPVEDAGHLPFMEHPEVVNPALLAFLAGH